MTQLNEVQRKLAEQLLLSVKNKEMNVEYNELAQRISPPIHWRQVGKNIGEISKLCHELGLPLLSAKVVNKNSQRAGEGFYPLYEFLGIPTEGKTEKELFRQERDAIRNCKEWYKLEDYLGLHIGFERPEGMAAPNTPAGNISVAHHTESWIIACNPKNYDVDAAFSKLQVIDWKQSFKANVGDTVYIYVAAPIKAVKYKCTVNETNKPKITIDDSEFVLDGTPFSAYGKHMALQLDAKFSTPISLERLKTVGIDRIQGPIKARSEVVQLLENYGFLEDGIAAPIVDTVIPVSKVETPPPPEYLKPDVHIFSVANPTPFRLSVDVLNYGFGSQYVGAFKKGWQQAIYDFIADGTSYLIWFPKISTDGKPASTYGWINSVVDGGSRIIEEAADTHPELGFEVDDQIRFVFPKTGNGSYLFSGVFLPDRERCTYRHHEYVKVADEADCSGAAPKIYYFKREDSEDESLVAELRADALTGVPGQYKYQGKAKEKAAPIEAAGRRIYPRDRQTSINALSHAGFHCEIDSNHPTFLRRNSSKPYTEPHHLIPMAFSDEFDVSLDVEENIVSLCSNCHNHIHYGQGADALLKVLYLERNEDLKRVGINITFEQLLSFYK